MLLSKILFVVIEAGAAAYLAPLWKKWLKDNRDGWGVVAGNGAITWIRKNHINDLPIQKLPLNPTQGTIQRIFLDYKPDYLLSSATGNELEEWFIREAINSQIPSGQFIDTWYGYQSRFVKHSRLPDKILVIDNRAYFEAISEGLPKDRLKIIGQPAWEKITVYPDASEDIFLFICQPIRKNYQSRLGYDELDAWHLLLDYREKYPDQVKQLIYAPHPTGSAIEIEQYNNIEICHNSQFAIARSGIITGMFSSLLTDAFLSGRKVISLQPGLPAIDMSSLSRHDYIKRVGCAKSLNRALKLFSKDKEPLSKILCGSLQRLEFFIEKEN